MNSSWYLSCRNALWLGCDLGETKGFNWKQEVGYDSIPDRTWRSIKILLSFKGNFIDGNRWQMHLTWWLWLFGPSWIVP